MKEWSYLVTKDTLTEKMCILPKHYNLIAGYLCCVWIHSCLGKRFVHTTIWGNPDTLELRLEVRSVECLIDKGQQFMVYFTLSNHDTE